MIRCELGRLTEGTADIERALRLADGVTIPPETLMFCLAMSGYAQRFIGATATAAGRSQHLLQLAEASGSPFWKQLAHLCAGLTSTTLGNGEAAVSQLERSREVARERGLRVWNEPASLAALADAYRDMGRLADARTAALAGIEAGRRERLRPGEARALIVLARALIAAGATETDDIEAALLRAQTLVEQTDARGYLPFIAEARAELAHVRGDTIGAASALAEAHRLFTEMGATGHARRLAEELGC